jgi:hypothetical protein
VSGELGVDTDRLVGASDVLAGAGADLHRAAGGVDRRVPPLPDDEHGLVLAIVAFDEAREGFDRRVADELAGLAEDLADQALSVAAADRFIPLPAVGR